MARRVFKYTLGPGRGYVVMPGGARVLSAQMQGGDMRVWAHIDEDRLPVRYTFFVAGTGHKLPDDLPPTSWPPCRWTAARWFGTCLRMRRWRGERSQRKQLG